MCSDAGLNDVQNNSSVVLRCERGVLVLLADRQCSTRGHCSVSLALTSDWTLKRRVLTPIKTPGSALIPTPPFSVLSPKTGTGIWCFVFIKIARVGMQCFLLKIE